MAKKPGNPNFTAGNRVGVLLSEPLTGEKTIPVSTKLPASLKAEFDELPGTASQKLRQAVELLIAQSKKLED